MQYLKHGWDISHLDRMWGIVPLLHSELSLFLMVTALLVVFVPSFLAGLSILSAYYYLSLLDFLIWNYLSRPFHPADIKRFVELVIYFPAFASLNASLTAAIVFFVFLPIPIALLILHLWKKRAQRSTMVKNCPLHGTAAFFVLYILLFPLVGFDGYFQNNSLVRMFQEMGFEYELTHMPVSQRDVDPLLGQPVPGDGGRGRGHSHGKMNIILFIMETAPYTYYSAQMKEFAREVRRMYPRGTASLREHYTTYPESDRATLSILTGNYPALGHGSTWVGTYDYSHSLPRVLKQNGYKTFLLSTAPLDFQDDRKMLTGLGFDSILEIGRSGKGRFDNGKGRPEPESLYEADEEMLRGALDIISAKPSYNYFLVLLPQASHSPFKTPPEYSGDGSQESLIRANAAWQLNLIRTLMRQVAERGEKGRTCFIVTGDHGLRHPAETSLFDELDWLSPLTFHVPLILLSPHVLPQIKAASTSHVDITPTILEMNGLPYEAGRYQGISMFRKSRRMVFFLGGDYLPVYGFKKDDMFFMENRYRGLILHSPSMEFRASVQKHGLKALMCSEVDSARISYSLNTLRCYLLHPRGSPAAMGSSTLSKQR